MKKYKLIKWYPSLSRVLKDKNLTAIKDKELYIYDLKTDGKIIQTLKGSEIENNPEFWEEVDDKNPLNLEVGKEYILQYVHCKSKPIRVKITRFTQDGYPWKEGVNCDTNGIVSPDCWKLIEEVVEKDYEILSFIEKGSDILFQKLANVKSGDNNLAYSCNKKDIYTYHECLNNCLEIHSVKRLSDGKVFSIGDKVKNTNYPDINGKIYEISLAEDKIRVYYQGFDILENISHCKKVLFKSEDGVDIFEGDLITSVNLNTLKIHATTPIKTGESLKYGNYRHFSTKEAAEEYILMNKPCLLSINDIKFLQTIPDFELVKSLKKVVKSKL